MNNIMSESGHFRTMSYGKFRTHPVYVKSIIILLLVMSQWSNSYAVETNSGPENTEYKLLSDSVTAKKIYKDNDNYYYNGEKLEFGSTGGELFTTLYSNPDSRRLARSARNTYRKSNIISWPLVLAGIIMYLEGESYERDGHTNTDNYFKGLGGALAIVGFSFKISLSNSGKDKYDMAIIRYNESQ